VAGATSGQVSPSPGRSSGTAPAIEGHGGLIGPTRAGLQSAVVSFRRATAPLRSAAAPVVELHEVTVRFGPTVVLRDVSLPVASGSYWEVRGENGSGKTTLLRALAGVCPPVSGRRDGVRSVAFVPAAIDPPTMPVRSWLAAVRDRRNPVEEALEALAFHGDLTRSFRHLSYGNLRKVLLADALSSRSALVVIDEAREGLDDAGIGGLDGLVARARSQQVAVVIADQVAHRVPDQAGTISVVDGVLDIGPTGVDRPAATLRFSGPAAGATALEREAANLGFRRVDDG